MTLCVNLLIIENVEEDFRLIQHCLQNDGLNARYRQVSHRDELNEAIENDTWDVVLAGYNVPELPFGETLSAIRQRHPGLPVILVSSHVDDAAAADLRKQGVCDFVPKDRLAHLTPAIERVISDARVQRDSGIDYRDLFESISDAISILDESGRILDVNQATIAMYGYPRDYFIGRTMQDLAAPGLNDLKQMAETLRKCLTGESCDFEFQAVRANGDVFLQSVHLNSVTRAERRSLVATAHDITAHKAAENALIQQRDLLRTILESIPTRVFWKDRDLRFLGANTAFAADAGIASPQVLIGKNDYELPWRDQAALYQADDRKVMESGRAKIGYEEPQTTPDGQTIWLRTSKVPLHDARGETLGVLGVYDDITDIKASEVQLRRFNRLYAVLGSINEAIVHCHDKESLFSECCRIAVEQGGFLLAWVGLVDPETHDVRILKHSGEAGDYLDHLHIHLANDSLGRGPTGRALQQGDTTVCNDIAHDRRMSPWRDHALRMGYRASAAFPIKVSGEVRYSLSLYSDRAGFFDADEVRLLDRLSGNIGYALDAIDSETHRMEAVDALRASEEWTRQIIDSIPDTVLVVNQERRIVRANTQMERMFGYRFDELAGRPIEILLPENKRDNHDKLCAGYLAAPTQRQIGKGMAMEARRRDGSLFPVEINLTPLETMGQSQVIVSLRDITEHKAAEDLMQRDREQQATLRKLLETTLADDALEQTLAQCLEQLLVVSWLALLPRGGIFLMGEDGKHLRLAVAHNLSPEIQTLCARVPLGHCHCGKAADNCTMQFADCVDASHETRYPGMTDHGHYCLPLLSNAGPLGVLVLYLPPGFARDALREQFLASVADILAGYISRKQHEDRLRRAAAVLESTHEGVLITDLDSRIVVINPAFTQITGYSETEILGKTPSLLRSEHHDTAFYRQLWTSVEQNGFWQGEIWNRRKSGEVYPEWLTISAVRDERGDVTNYVGVFSDISQIKNAEERLTHLAHYDALTDLPNRVLMQTLLKHALDRARREDHVLAVLFMDLDRFKNINDSLGHTAGDELLQIASSRLRERIRNSDTVARLGGDEFVLLLEELHDTDDAANIAQNVINLFNQSIRLSTGQDVYVGASIGISVFPNDGNTADELIRNADTAMYQAKAGGRNTYRFYTESLTLHAEQRLRLEGRLRRALEKGEMLLHYQPLVANGRCKGMEALVRWQDPDEGLVPPMQFIPLAEETLIILPLGEWVLRTACARMKDWLDAGIALETIAVNLSPVQFQQADFVQMTHTILLETGLPASHLELEITEGAIMGQGQEAEEKLAALQDLGVRISIDDFGTGYSSLAYLKRFPINKLKIDQSFVRDIPDNSASMEIAATIIAMARNLKLEVLAEGVETQQQLAYLKSLGCDTFQGYLFSRPMPAEAIPGIVKQKFY
jgi:diguanylate cyclase (GGDEF)-like protein/PAS domain S-box-containing protein